MSKLEYLKNQIREIVKEIKDDLEEETTTANVDGYQTPNAFSSDDDEERRKKVASQLGYTIVDDDVDNITEAAEFKPWRIEVTLLDVNPREFASVVSKHWQRVHKVKVVGSGKNWMITSLDKTGSSSNHVIKVLSRLYGENEIKFKELSAESVNEAMFTYEPRDTNRPFGAFDKAKQPTAWRLQITLLDVDPNEFQKFISKGFQRTHKITISGSGNTWILKGDSKRGSFFGTIVSILQREYPKGKIKIRQLKLESFGAELDVIKKSSNDVKDFIRKVFSNKDFNSLKGDSDFTRYLASMYNESVNESKFNGNLSGDVAEYIANELSHYVKGIIDQSNRKVTYLHLKDKSYKGKVIKTLKDIYGLNAKDGGTLFSPSPTVVFSNNEILESKINEGKVILKTTVKSDDDFSKVSSLLKGKNIKYAWSSEQGTLIFNNDSDKNKAKSVLGDKWIAEGRRPKGPVNRWLELKNDDSMHANKKLAMGLKELKYQLTEVEKFFNWYNKIKNINELDSDNYWKRTNRHIYKIKERLINIAHTIKEIEK